MTITEYWETQFTDVRAADLIQFSIRQAKLSFYFCDSVDILQFFQKQL